MEWSQILEAAGWLCIWFADSPAVTFLIKGVLVDRRLAFPHPLLLTGLINAQTFIIIRTLVQALHQSGVPGYTDMAQVSWKRASIIGTLQGIEISMGNAVLGLVSVALRTEFFMATPVLMFSAAVICGLEQPRMVLIFATVLVTIGGMMATTGRLQTAGFSVIALVLGQAFAAIARWILTQKYLLGKNGNKPSPMVLAARISPFTANVALLAALIWEPEAFPALVYGPHPLEVLGRSFAMALGVCLLLISELRVVQLTSALLLGIFMPFHNVIIILLGVVIYHDVVSGLNWGGILICSLGTGIYALARSREAESITALAVGSDTTAGVELRSPEEMGISYEPLNTQDSLEGPGTVKGLGV